MKRLSKEDADLIVDSMFKYATFSQAIAVCYWDLLVRYKRNALIDKLKAGEHWYFAYNEVKNLKK